MNENVLESVNGMITADPNPVPFETGAMTTLRWETNTPDAEVYVLEEGATEQLLARGPDRNVDIDWIHAGKSYLFRLYQASPRQLLSEVEVKKSVAGKIEVTSEALAGANNSKLTLQWETNAPEAEVCVCEDGSDERLYARGAKDKADLDWIHAGVSYLFRLYQASPRQLLSEAEVTKPVAGKIEAISEAVGGADNSKTTLQWETNVAEAEVCVREDSSAERLYARGAKGSVDLDWIQAGVSYLFRLYRSSSPNQLLGEVVVNKAIVGQIRAVPNPVPIENGCATTLHWEIASPAVGEITVEDQLGIEKTVCCGTSSSFEVTGLRPGVEYHFRLYALTRTKSRELLHQVVVRLSDIPWSLLWERLQAGSEEAGYSDDFAQFLGNVLPICVHRADYPSWFGLWERNGVHVTPVHFYEPIPDTQTLPDKLWEQPQQLPGVDLNHDRQRHLLCEDFPVFRQEYQAIPESPTDDEGEFYLDNGRFEGLDPLLAYCMVRHFKPRQIVEVGSGFSTLILSKAALQNGTTELHSIEPYPEEFLRKGMAGLTSLTIAKVEEVSLQRFTQLESGDCLFIDSSHVVRIGGDVNYLFLEVLPRLQPGVLVHVHDIFLPFEYPQDWVLERRRFWTEQYLLQAFLTFNREFEVLASSGYMNKNFPSELKVVFPTAAPWGGGSFWMRRKTEDTLPIT